MKRFEFPLERVRQYRKLQLDTEQTRLEQLLARLGAVDSMIADLHRQEVQVLADSRAVRSRGGPEAVADALHHSRFQEYLNRMRRMLAEQRTQAEQALQRQRLILLEARRHYEILNRAREASRTTWNAEFAREQENLASELFLAKHARDSRAQSRD